MNRTKLRSNIWKVFALMMMAEALFFVAVMIPFFSEEIGLSDSKILYLITFFSALIVVLEIPSGYLSDYWGRKHTLVTGSLFGIIGMATFSFASDYWAFFVAYACFAVMASFYSGTVEAITKDTLLALDKDENAYRKIRAKQSIWGSITKGVAVVVGGYLAAVSLRLPFYATMVPLAMGLFIALSLQEPERYKLQETRHLRAMWRILSNSMRNVPLRSIFALYIVLNSLICLLAWLTPFYLKELELSTEYYGIVAAIMLLSCAFITGASLKVKDWLDDRMILLAISAITIGCYLTLGFEASVWGILLFILGRMSVGALEVLTSDMVNQMCESDVRATVISVQSCAFRIIFSVITFLIGFLKLMEIYSLNQLMLFIGILGALVLGTILVLMRNVWKDLPS